MRVPLEEEADEGDMSRSYEIPLVSLIYCFPSRRAPERPAFSRDEMYQKWEEFRVECRGKLGERCSGNYKPISELKDLR